MQALASLYKSVTVFTLTFDYLQRSYLECADKQQLTSDWAQDILTKVGVAVQVIGEPSAQSPLLLVGNHISYLDIPILMHTAPNTSFVAKQEVSKWPVIGAGARALNTIFVQRDRSENRAVARQSIARELTSGKRVALFPSGTTCMEESKPWKKGAFEIAKLAGVQIQPFRIRYSQQRVAAYIGRDFFPFHLYQLARAGGLSATIEFHAPVHVEDAEESCRIWRSWSQTIEW